MLNINGIDRPAPTDDIMRPASNTQKLGASPATIEPAIKATAAVKNSCLAEKRSFKYELDTIITEIVNK